MEKEHGKDDKDHAEEDTDCYFSQEDVIDSEYRSICYLKDSFNMTISCIDESISPISYQLRTPIEEASENAVKSLKRKFSQCINVSTDFICDSLASGQGEELKNLLLSDRNKKESAKIPVELSSLVESCKLAPSQQVRYLILSLVPLKFSKSDRMNFFVCSRYMIDQARRMKSESDPSVVVPKVSFTRNKLDFGKVKLFTEFFISNGYFQDVAYGTTFKLDSGQEIVVPHIIRTSIKLQLVKVYTDHCSLIGYKPLSQSSSLRILEGCKTSQRKALSGVYNYTADGYEGFEMIAKILQRLPLPKEDKNVFKLSLKSALVYLKGNYHLHVCKENLCASHCRTFPLSNPKSKDFKESCRHSHSETCHDCQNLFFCLESVIDLIHEHVKELEMKEELLYEVEVGTSYIFEWVKHIMRGVHTQDSKINALSNLDNESARFFGDWIMKILPQRYREKMEG